MKRFSPVWCIAVFLITACQPAITESTVEGVVARYFASQSYRVSELTISSIEPVPLSRQQYMGTEGYIVSMASITLERHQADAQGSSVSLTFSGAKLVVKKNSRNAPEEWAVDRIEGIAIP